MVTTYIASAKPTNVFLAVCAKCVRPLRKVEDDPRRTSDHINGHCPYCLSEIHYERVYGTVSKMECSWACMAAYGPSCSCSCGGKNHGDVWMKTGEILAGALEKYRAEIAEKAAARERRATAEREAKLSAFETWRIGRETVVNRLLSTDWLSQDWPNEFLQDLADQLRELKPLSDRQVEAAERTLTKRDAAAQREANRKLNLAAVPEGRQVIEGTIVGTYRVPDQHSYLGGEILHIIVDTGTFTVSGTCPRSLIMPDGSLWFKHDSDFMGRKVRFTATIKPGNELGKGWFSRPTKAEFTDG